MPQDAFTLRHLCRELNDIFSGGKINKIVQPSCDKVVFSIYTNGVVGRLLVSVDPSCPRMGVQNFDEKATDTPPFCQLLRKHLLGATVNEIELVGFDRIVKISCTPSKEFFDQSDKIIYVELMGRYSNVILTENGKILGGNRGINMFDDGIRPLFAGQPYVFPPVSGKLLPNNEGLKDIFKSTKNVEESIFKSVQGVARSTADWIVESYAQEKRVCKNDVRAYVNSHSEEFFIYMRNRLFCEDIKPCVKRENGEICDVFAIPYDDADYIFFPKLYLAEDYYFSEKLQKEQLVLMSQRLNSLVSTCIKKATKRWNSILQKECDAQSLEENKIKGELIIANIYKIKRGDEKFVAENYYDGTTVEILLDANKTPSENAEAYYKKYAKQKRTIEALKPQRESAKRELDYYLSVQDEISICETAEEYELILKEIKPVVNKKVKKKTDETTSHNYDIDGFTVRVGRSNIENDKLVGSAKRDSIWLHVKDYHSSHVVIEVLGRSVPERIIKIAAEITAYYSKCRETDKAEVVYTLKKNVKKPSGAKPGFVVYDNFKSITVVPSKHEEFIKGN